MNYNVEGTTPLMVASLQGKAEVVEALLAHKGEDGKGVDVDFQDHEGNTALTVASANGHADVVKLLERAQAIARSNKAGRLIQFKDND